MRVLGSVAFSHSRELPEHWQADSRWRFVLGQHILGPHEPTADTGRTLLHRPKPAPPPPSPLYSARRLPRPSHFTPPDPAPPLPCYDVISVRDSVLASAAGRTPNRSSHGASPPSPWSGAREFRRANYRARVLFLFPICAASGDGDVLWKEALPVLRYVPRPIGVAEEDAHHFSAASLAQARLQVMLPFALATPRQALRLGLAACPHRCSHRGCQHILTCHRLRRAHVRSQSRVGTRRRQCHKRHAVRPTTPQSWTGGTEFATTFKQWIELREKLPATVGNKAALQLAPGAPTDTASSGWNGSA